MATFNFKLYNVDGKCIESLSVVGRKMTTCGEFTNYYVGKPNKYGIRWICIDENDNAKNSYATSSKTINKIPIFANVKIYKCT